MKNLFERIGPKTVGDLFIRESEHNLVRLVKKHAGKTWKPEQWEEFALVASLVYELTFARKDAEYISSPPNDNNVKAFITSCVAAVENKEYTLFKIEFGYLFYKIKASNCTDAEIERSIDILSHLYYNSNNYDKRDDYSITRNIFWDEQKRRQLAEEPKTPEFVL